MDEKLQTLLDSYRKWLVSSRDDHSQTSRESSQWIKDNFLNPDALNLLSDEEYIVRFKQLLSYGDGPVSINWGSDRIIRFRKEFVRNIHFIIDNDGSAESVQRILTGDHKIDYAGRSVWSLIFSAAFPDKLPRVNNKTDRFFSSIGIEIGQDVSDRYLNIANYFNSWKALTGGTDLFELDHLMHYGTEIEEGKVIMKGMNSLVLTQEELTRLNRIVDDYVTQVNTFGAQEYADQHEGYKYEAVDTFQKNFNIDADALKENIELSLPSVIASGSMWNPKKMLTLFAERFPEETRQYLRELFDELEDPYKRMDACRHNFEKLVALLNQETGRKDTSYLDIRSMSLLLFLMYPYKYYLYKNEEFSKFISTVVDKKYSLPHKISAKYKIACDFAEALSRVIADREDVQAIKKVLSSSTNFKDEENRLIAQDIIYTTGAGHLKPTNTSMEKYWIFQGNPASYDLVNYFSEKLGQTITWAANQSSSEMQKGDVVYFWVSGDGGGLRAIGILQELAAQRPPDDPDKQFGDKYVAVKVIRAFDNNTLLSRADFMADPILSASSFVRRPQNTNFLLPRPEAAEIMRLLVKKNYVAVWSLAPGADGFLAHEIIDPGIISIGWDENDLGDLSNYSTKDEMRAKLLEGKDRDTKSRMNDSLAIFQFSKEMLPGDVVIFKTGRKTLLGFGQVVSEYMYKPLRDKHKHIRETATPVYGIWDIRDAKEPDFNNLVLKTLTNLTRYNTEKWNYFPNRLINFMLDEKSRSKEETMNEEESESNISLNTILYGPPGTGKTYRIDSIKNLLVGRQSAKESDIELDGYSWKDAVYLAFWQNNFAPLSVKNIEKSSMVQTYAKTKTSKSIYGTLSTTIIEHATESSTTSKYRRYTDLFEKTDDNLWALTSTGRLEANEIVNLIKLGSSRDQDYFFKLVTFHQSYGYEEFIEGIRAETDDVGNIRYEVRNGVFKAFCKRAEDDPDNNYLFAIDEINRGNISKIFGELITLIEPTKRLGAIEQMTTTLPYSGEKFGVPKNVYVVGTMNTADRSIALLDIALRRRFDFEEIMPNPRILSKDVNGVDLQQLLTAINAQVIEKIDRNHQIGHSYLMRITSLSDLRNAWYQRIVPLLQEYFYDDTEDLRSILGTFIENDEIVQLDGDGFKQALIHIYAETQSTDSGIQL